jgi:hypothetical protein
VGQSAIGFFESNPTSGSPRIANTPGDKASSDATCVLLAGADLSGKANTASSWFRHEALPAFRFKTVEQFVREGRTEDVLAYLQSLQAGAAG